MMNKICSLVIIYMWFLLFVKLHSRLENSLKKSPLIVDYSYIRWSLSFFKTTRSILFVLGAFESVFVSSWSVGLFLVGTVLSIIGIIMRVVAIKELGPMWSFHVVKYVKHSYVNTGIYKYIKHPAYVGNIYLTGLMLTIGAPFIAILSIIFIACFYIIRKFHEERILQEIGGQ